MIVSYIGTILYNFVPNEEIIVENKTILVQPAWAYFFEKG